MEKNGTALQPVSIALPKVLAVRIRVAAAKQNMSRSRFVRNMLEEALRSGEQPASPPEVEQCN